MTFGPPLDSAFPPKTIQIKQSVIEKNGLSRPQTTSAKPPALHRPTNKFLHHLPELHIEFKPLVQVDPSVLTTAVARGVPLQNPRPGDYLLNKTSSTEGIASKKSLELKKRYLLGESASPALTPSPLSSIGLMKSDSTSVLDSKFKHFHSNISAGQKMLAAPPSTTATAAATSNSGSSPAASCSTAPGLMHSATTIDMLPALQSRIAAAAQLSPPIGGGDKPTAVSTPAMPSTAVIVAPLPQPETPAETETATPLITHETIDLCTPDKSQRDIRRLNLTEEIRKNEEFIRKLDQTAPPTATSSLNSDTLLTIDLTEEVTPERRSSGDKNAAAAAAAAASAAAAERSKVAIDAMLAVTTTTVAAAAATNASAALKDPQSTTILEEDSLSSSISLTSSSTSSVDEIPHYVLDSTTSPETHRAESTAKDQLVLSAVTTPPETRTTQTPFEPSPPSVASRHHHDELMQIDSLMIVDGKYVGDPADLVHMRLPADVNAAAVRAQPAEQPPLIEPPPLNIPSPFRLGASAAPRREYVRPLRSTASAGGALRPELKFDTRNENKIDTLQSMPRPAKPCQLDVQRPLVAVTDAAVDLDKTPTAAAPSTAVLSGTGKSAKQLQQQQHSDSETEDVETGAGLTETELSDWAADDAVSENFVDIEFVLNSNKGTIKRNKKKRHSHQLAANLKSTAAAGEPTTSGGGGPSQRSSGSGSGKKAAEQQQRCPLARDLELDEIEFMDTGSEDSCMESYSATNQAMLRNRGYVQFVQTTIAPVESATRTTPNAVGQLPASARCLSERSANSTATGTTATPVNSKQDAYSYKSDAGYGSSPKDSLDRNVAVEDVIQERPGIDYIEQGACVLGKLLYSF